MINYIADEAWAISNEIFQWFWTFLLWFLEFVVLFCLPQSRRTPVSSVKEQTPFFTDPFFTLITKVMEIHYHCSENVTEKANSSCFKLHDHPI